MKVRPIYESKKKATNKQKNKQKNKTKQKKNNIFLSLAKHYILYMEIFSILVVKHGSTWSNR